MKWLHHFPDEPNFLFSELDDELFETRKVELFADGRAFFASERECHGDTGLSSEPLPSLEEIGADPEFEPEPISAAEFEAAWTEAKSKVNQS